MLACNNENDMDDDDDDSNKNDDHDNFYGMAIKALKNEKYNLAIELFGKVLNLHYKSDIKIAASALEGRAACFEKLKNYEKAQSDARSIISLCPHLHKGYLRLGKIYRLAKRPEDAVRIYSMGLKKTTTGHLELQKQLDALKRQMNNITRSIDLFKELPVEIILKIFNHLDRDTMESFCKCSKTNLSFRYNHHHLKHSIRFTIQGPVVLGAVKVAMERSIFTKWIISSRIAFDRILGKPPTSLRRLVLTDLNLHTNYPEQVMSNFVKLEELELHRCAISLRLLKRILLQNGISRLVIKQCHLSNSIENEGIQTIRVNFGQFTTLLIDLCNLQNLNVYYQLKQENPSMNFACDEIKWYEPFLQSHLSFEHLMQKFESHNIKRHTFKGSSILKSLFIDGASCPEIIPTALKRLMCARIESLDNVTMEQGSPYQLQSLFILEPIENIDHLVRILQKFPLLRELGIRSISSQCKVIDPKKVIELLLSGSKKRLLCLPFLDPLPMKTKCTITAIHPDCRIIFDRGICQRLAQRFWKSSFDSIISES